MSGTRMFWLNSLYLLALTGAPISLGFTWYDWFHCPRVQSAKWRTFILFSGLCAGTTNFVLWWIWVVWLRFHYNSESWRVRDIVSEVGLYLYSVFHCSRDCRKWKAPAAVRHWRCSSSTALD